MIWQWAAPERTVSNGERGERASGRSSEKDTDGDAGAVRLWVWRPPLPGAIIELLVRVGKTAGAKET